MLPGVASAPEGVGENVGAIAEQLTEWLYGEGEARKAFEGLSAAEKMKTIADTAKTVEKTPALAAKIGQMIRRSLATGAGAATQAAAHGSDLEDTVKAGLLGAGGTAVLETGGMALSAARRAAAAPAARQAAAQAGVKDVARDATEAALNRINEARQPQTISTPIGKPSAAIPARAGAATIDQGITTAAQRAQLGSRADVVPSRLLPSNPIVDEIGNRAALVPGRIWDEVGNPALDLAQESTKGPNFEPVDARAEAADTGSFGHGAEKIREAAKPVYDAIDTATGGKFNELQAARSAAYRAGDAEAVTKADGAIDSLLDSAKGVDKPDLMAARSAWKDSKVLDKLHNTVEGAFNGISEEMAAQPGTGERLLRTGNSQGSSLQSRLGILFRKPGTLADAERVIGKEGVTNLYRSAALVSEPATKSLTMTMAQATARLLGSAALGGIAHQMGVPAALSIPAGVAAEEGTRLVLRKMVTSPRIGQMMDFAVRNNVSPKVAAGLIAAEMQRERGEDAAPEEKP